MAYRAPTFNVWAEVFTDAGVSRGWTLCQVRGPSNSVWAWLPGLGEDAQNIVYWEILLPRGSDVRGPKNDAAQMGDTIRLKGLQTMAYRVIWVGDKAAGFTNEYRLVFAYWQPSPAGNQPLLRVNTAFAPPGGFTPLPLVAIS